MTTATTNPSPPTNANTNTNTTDTNSTPHDPIKRKHPCILCQQRKVKCDRNDPCSNCARARVKCLSPNLLQPKKRKKRFPEAELLARLRRYEDVLRGYV